MRDYTSSRAKVFSMVIRSFSRLQSAMMSE